MNNLVFVFFFFGSGYFALSQNIQTKVVDSTGATIPYANVIINNYYHVQTNSEGLFNMFDYEREQSLLIQKVGKFGAFFVVSKPDHCVT